MSEGKGTRWTCYDAGTMTTREIYGRVLAELCRSDDRIVGLSADLSKSTAITFMEKEFPDRFFNVGIAEQNLMGISAGLAKMGFIPFASTFAAFASMRAAEQIRTDVCYQNLPVKIIATHGGVSFGAAGTTHHCTEDLAILRSFPNMTVIVPADGTETANAVRAAVALPGPVYIRIGRGFEPPFHANEDYGFRIGKAYTVREGKDLTIIACGIGVLQAAEAARFLEERDGISVGVIDMHTLKPLDEESVLKALGDTRRILTVEEHSVIGGLGSAVSDVIARSGKGCAFRSLGLPDAFSEVGYPEDLYAHYGLTADGIVEAARDLLRLEYEEDDSWEDEV